MNQTEEFQTPVSSLHNREGDASSCELFCGGSLLWMSYSVHAGPSTQYEVQDAPWDAGSAGGSTHVSCRAYQEPEYGGQRTKAKFNVFQSSSCPWILGPLYNEGLGELKQRLCSHPFKCGLPLTHRRLNPLGQKDSCSAPYKVLAKVNGKSCECSNEKKNVSSNDVERLSQLPSLCFKKKINTFKAFLQVLRCFHTSSVPKNPHIGIPPHISWQASSDYKVSRKMSQRETNVFWNFSNRNNSVVGQRSIASGMRRRKRADTARLGVQTCSFSSSALVD